MFYNYKLEDRWFFTRIIGLLRSFLMMGALVPFNINIMSVYGCTFSLLIDGNYTHPAYQMEDIICYIRWMIRIKKWVTIRPLFAPTVSGVTSGNTLWEEINECIAQLIRWTIGSAEVFHYFAKGIHRIPVCAGISWGILYIMYYAIFLCA